MFFEISKETYGIKFSRVGRRTFAELMKVKRNGELSHTDIVGECSLYYKDTFVAETGRKIALTNLIEEIDKKIGLTKEERGTIWKEFFETHKK